MRNTLRLYITADGRPAVRAFEEVGQASSRTASRVEHDARRQRDSFAMVEEGSGKLKGAVASLAGTVGLGGLAFGIADVVKAGEQWQLQQAQLANALRSTGQYSTRTMALVRSSAEALSTAGGFAGPEEISAITQFIRLTGSATKAIQLNKEATDLARGTGIGYGQAQRMVAQVLTGNTGRLQRYLGIIQPVKTAEFALSQAHKVNVFQLELQSKALGRLGPAWLRHQEILHNLTPTQLQHAQLLDRQATAQEALARIQAKYGNATQTFSRTTAGAISNLRNRFDLLGETIGRKVLPVVSAIVQFLSHHTTAVLVLTGAVAVLGVTYATVTAATVAWGAVTVAAGAIATAFGAVLTGVRTAVLVLGLAFEGLGLSATAAWAAATVGISLLIAGIVLVATHFTEFKRIVAGVWDWLKGAVSSVVSFIGQHWQLILSILTGPFGAAAIFIATHFQQIVAFLGGIVSTIGHVFSTVFHVLTAPFRFAWSVIKTIIDEIKKAIGTITSLPGHIVHGIAHAAGSVLSTATFGLLHTGGLVRPKYMAVGGPVGSDTVPGWLTPGEYVLRREAVQQIGVTNLNSINAGGALAGQGPPDGEVWVTMPVTLVLPNGRVLTQQVVHTSAKRAAVA